MEKMTDNISLIYFLGTLYPSSVLWNVDRQSTNQQ